MKLVIADIIRDGGSYEAIFERDDGSLYCVDLVCSRMPDAAGLHHRWLIENGDAIPTGSKAESDLIDRLNSYLVCHQGSTASSESTQNLEQLKKLIYYIGRRECCSTEDVERYTEAKSKGLPFRFLDVLNG